MMEVTPLDGPWYLASGEPCSLPEVAAELNLSELETIKLFDRYCNRWWMLHKYHGVNATCNTYRTPDGKESTLAILAATYGLSAANVSREFTAANNDYIAANKRLQEKKEEKSAKLLKAKLKTELEQEKAEKKAAKLSKLNPIDKMTAREAKAVLNDIASLLGIGGKHRTREALLSKVEVRV